MIKSNERMFGEQNNPIVNRHLKLEIKTLQNAPRGDADKLEWLLKSKERKKHQEAMHIEETHTERLVTEEIEMLKVVLHLVVSRGEEEVQNGKKKEGRKS
jgi:hypothetical protein